MKILQLTIKKEWFDLIASDQKKKEYIEDKPYWQKRLFDKYGKPKHFDIVRFKNRNGNIQTMDVEFKRIAFTGSGWINPEHGETIWPSTIVILLGKVLSIY